MNRLPIAAPAMRSGGPDFHDFALLRRICQDWLMALEPETPRLLHLLAWHWSEFSHGAQQELTGRFLAPLLPVEGATIADTRRVCDSVVEGWRVMALGRLRREMTPGEQARSLSVPVRDGNGQGSKH